MKLALLFAAVAASLKQCGCDSVDGKCPQPVYTLNCPPIDSKGYGEINAKSREEAQEKANAENQYESENERLKWEGTNSECSSEKGERTGELVSSETITLSGSFDASHEGDECHAGKVGHAGKGATCFKRESTQHLNELGSDLPGPLEDRTLVGCSAESPKYYKGKSSCGGYL